MGGDVPGPRVLLVEDNIVVAQAIEWMFRDLGCAVVRAGSVAEALAMLGNVDVLLSDYRLPDGTGIDLYLRLGDARPKTVALMSAYLEDAIQQRATEVGFDECFDKKHFTHEMLTKLLKATGEGGGDRRDCVD